MFLIPASSITHSMFLIAASSITQSMFLIAASSITQSMFLIAAFPAPMLYGFIIDQACLVTQTSCTRTGACLLYDADTLRYVMHGTTACFKLAAFLVYILAFLWSRNKDKKDARKKALEEAKGDGKEMLPLKS
jgi:hypothetical protein